MNKIIGFVLLSSIILLVTEFQIAIAQENQVPDWFKGVAGFWSQGLISTDEFIDGIEFLIQEGIIQVPSSSTSSSSSSSSSGNISEETALQIWAEISKIEDQINNVVPINGTEGPQGPMGPQGPPGPKGNSGNDGADGKIMTSSIYRKTNTVYPEPNVEGYYEARCDSPDILLTGGDNVSRAGDVLGSFPLLDDKQNKPIGWVVHTKRYSDPLTVNVYAICINVPVRASSFESDENIINQIDYNFKDDLETLFNSILMNNMQSVSAQELDTDSEQALWSAVNNLKAQVENIEPMPGLAGPPGTTGPAGFPGPIGQNGPSSRASGENSEINPNYFYTLIDIFSYEDPGDPKRHEFKLRSHELTCDSSDTETTFGYDTKSGLGIFLNRDDSRFIFNTRTQGTIELYVVCSDSPPLHSDPVRGFS